VIEQWDGLLEYSVDMPVKWNPVCFRNSSKTAFSISFTTRAGDVSACSETFFTRIASFTSWFHQGDTFLPPVATPGRFCPHTRPADKMTTALKNRYSSASDAHSGSSRNKDGLLFAKVFLTYLFTRDPTLFGRTPSLARLSLARYSIRELLATRR